MVGTPIKWHYGPQTVRNGENGSKGGWELPRVEPVAFGIPCQCSATELHLLSPIVIYRSNLHARLICLYYIFQLCQLHSFHCKCRFKIPSQCKWHVLTTFHAGRSSISQLQLTLQCVRIGLNYIMMIWFSELHVEMCQLSTEGQIV